MREIKMMDFNFQKLIFELFSNIWELRSRSNVDWSIFIIDCLIYKHTYVCAERFDASECKMPSVNFVRCVRFDLCRQFQCYGKETFHKFFIFIFVSDLFFFLHSRRFMGFVYLFIFEISAIEFHTGNFVITISPFNIAVQCCLFSLSFVYNQFFFPEFPC